MEMMTMRLFESTKRKLLLLGIIIVMAAFAVAFLGSDPVSQRVANSPQYGDGAFRNPGENIEFSFGTTIASMWDFFFKGQDRKPNTALPMQEVNLSEFENATDNQLRVTWIGHSSLMINMDGIRILADPVFEKSASFFGPTRFNGDLPVDVENLPDVDLVVISHDHYDHLNKHSIQKIHHKASSFIVPLGVGRILQSWGVPENKITELDWWEEHRVHDALTVVSTPAQHFSGRGLTNRNGTLWTSFVIRSENHSVFFGGDSGYFDGFKEIGERYGPFDMTFLECGAYNKKWAAIHMFPEQTVQAHLDLRGNVLHPIHWGTYDLAMHSWFDPMQRIAIAAKSAEVTLATPVVGGTTIYNEDSPNDAWWEKAISGATRVTGD